MNRVVQFPGQVLNFLGESSFWKRILGNVYISPVILFVLAVISGFPSVDILYYRPELVSRFPDQWDAIILQVAEPFVNHNHLYAEGSHFDKLAFRFIPALIMKLFQLNTMLGGWIFIVVTAVVFYYTLYLLLSSLLKDKILAFFYCVPICFTYTGILYANDFLGYFDTLALTFLMWAIYLRKKPTIIIPLLLAFFTDERSIIAAPAIFLITLFEDGTFVDAKIIKAFISKTAIYLVLSLVIYGILRFLLGHYFNLVMRRGLTDCFWDQIGLSGYTIYIGLEALFICVVAAIASLAKGKHYLFISLIIVSFALLFYAAQSVEDINRSMSYNLPWLVLILLLFNHYYNKKTVLTVLGWAAILNFLMYDPDFFPLPAQIFRMLFITQYN